MGKPKQSEEDGTKEIQDSEDNNSKIEEYSKAVLKTAPKIGQLVNQITNVVDWTGFNNNNSIILDELYEKSDRFAQSLINNNNSVQKFTYIPISEVVIDPLKTKDPSEISFRIDNDKYTPSYLQVTPQKYLHEDDFGKSVELLDVITTSTNFLSDTLDSTIKLTQSILDVPPFDESILDVSLMGQSLIDATKIDLPVIEDTHKYLSALNIETGLILDESANLLSSQFYSHSKLQARVYDLENDLEIKDREIGLLKQNIQTINQKLDQGENAREKLSRKIDGLNKTISVYETLIKEKHHILAETNGKIALLILGANYELTNIEVRISKEIQHIQNDIKSSNLRDNFNIKTEPMVTREHFQRYLAETKPSILLCIGHGTLDDGILFHGDATGFSMGNLDNTSNILANYNHIIKLIILNICQSSILAKKLQTDTNIVIGTTDDVDDDAAIEFSSTFFTSFANGDSFLTSFLNAQEGYRNQDSKKKKPYEYYTSLSEHELKLFSYKNCM